MVHGLYHWATFMYKWLQRYFLTYVDHLTKYIVLTECTLGVGGIERQTSSANVFPGCCQTIWPT